MKVSDILGVKGNAVTTIRPEAKISTVVRRLKLEGIGAMVVTEGSVEDSPQVVGIISERDIVRGLVDEGAELLEKQVLDLMTSPVKTCTMDANIKDIMAVMTRRRIRHLPVVEESRLVGIISIGDVVKNRLEEVELEADVLRDAYIASH
jgi:CBS domain-containing protein